MNMEMLTDAQKEEVERNWQYFTSIHEDLIKHEMHLYKWIVITDQKCVDIFNNYESALELTAYRHGGKIISIILVKEKLDECQHALIHYIEKKKISFGDEDPSKSFDEKMLDMFPDAVPLGEAVGYGAWKANERNHPDGLLVKKLIYANASRPMIQTKEKIVFVSIRLLEDEKTHLGLYLGEFAYHKYATYNKEKKQLIVHESGHGMMPVIYVPNLKKCVFGYECYWGKIKDPKEVRDITNKDLDAWGDTVRTMISMFESVKERNEKSV